MSSKVQLHDVLSTSFKLITPSRDGQQAATQKNDSRGGLITKMEKNNLITCRFFQ